MHVGKQIKTLEISEWRIINKIEQFKLQNLQTMVIILKKYVSFENKIIKKIKKLLWKTYLILYYFFHYLVNVLKKWLKTF